jgi:hypothetical protein
MSDTSCCRSKFKIIRTYIVSALGGVIVSVLAIGPKVRGFKRGRGDGFLRTIEIRSTLSFGGEIRPSVPCRQILWYVKELYEYERDIS